jgi:excisionase family DNA binding protein
MLSVPEAARRIRRNPETIRRWIREGKLRSERIGTQHFVDPRDLERMSTPEAAPVLPEEWRVTRWGDPMPDIVGAIRRTRGER